MGTRARNEGVRLGVSEGVGRRPRHYPPPLPPHLTPSHTIRLAPEHAGRGNEGVQGVGTRWERGVRSGRGLGVGCRGELRATTLMRAQAKQMRGEGYRGEGGNDTNGGGNEGVNDGTIPLPSSHLTSPPPPLSLHPPLPRPATLFAS